MKYLNWLLGLLLDERGEDDPAAAGQDAGAPADAGQDDAPPANQDNQDGGDSGAGDKPPATTPKYGEFGDTPTPDQIFEAYGKTKKEFDDFRTKAGLTEKNLAQTRKFLQSVGLVQQQDGTWVMPQRQAQEKKTRFTDDHKKLFHPQVFSAIDAYVQDKIEEAFSGYGQHQSQLTQWNTAYGSAVQKMYKFYPALQENSPNFNKAFRERAQEILNSNQDYLESANGDLMAAHEAALELGISPIAIEKAKKEGHEQGVAEKRVLGTVKSSGGRPAGKGRLTKEQYLKLPPAEREKYDAAGIVT